jgi:ATP-binding cassette subfamily B protein
MSALALFERIFAYLDLVPEVRDRPGARRLRQVQGAVRFEDVSFEYVAGRLALQELSFEARPGQLVALVGPSGAGKTTVTYLVPRLYDPTRGRVTLDGYDLRDVELASLRRQIGMVTQETYLFNATVRENLLYARADASQRELEAACRAAYLDEFIANLPDRYDTLVGERGYRLSGGEKQRLAIARVLLANPRVLVLDEATSSLDSRSEAYIQAALAPLLAGRTSLVIAHRLSTILAADQILVLDRGRLVERGAHAELLARGGLYARLYEEQFKTAVQPSDGSGSPAAPLAQRSRP